MNNKIHMLTMGVKAVPAYPILRFSAGILLCLRYRRPFHNHLNCPSHIKMHQETGKIHRLTTQCPWCLEWHRFKIHQRPIFPILILHITPILHTRSNR